MKKCVLEEKVCNDCGRCDDRCELDPNKICDNCFRCLDMMATQPYAEIPVSGVYAEEEDYIPDAGELHVEQRQLLHFSTLTGMTGKRGRQHRD